MPLAPASIIKPLLNLPLQQKVSKHRLKTSKTKQPPKPLRLSAIAVTLKSLSNQSQPSTARLVMQLQLSRRPLSLHPLFPPMLLPSKQSRPQLKPKRVFVRLLYMTLTLTLPRLFIHYTHNSQEESKPLLSWLNRLNLMLIAPQSYSLLLKHSKAMKPRLMLWRELRVPTMMQQPMLQQLARAVTHYKLLWMQSSPMLLTTMSRSMRLNNSVLHQTMLSLPLQT
jgi:hypothetical protein